MISSNPADFVQIVDPDGKHKDYPTLQVGSTGTGKSFENIAELNEVEEGDVVSVMLSSATTAAIEIV